jgi:hypothetical protein
MLASFQDISTPAFTVFLSFGAVQLRHCSILKYTTGKLTEQQQSFIDGCNRQNWCSLITKIIIMMITTPWL